MDALCWQVASLLTMDPQWQLASLLTLSAPRWKEHCSTALSISHGLLPWCTEEAIFQTSILEGWEDAICCLVSGKVS